jgi:hypothetical protein
VTRICRAAVKKIAGVSPQHNAKSSHVSPGSLVEFHWLEFHGLEFHGLEFHGLEFHWLEFHWLEFHWLEFHWLEFHWRARRPRHPARLEFPGLQPTRLELPRLE